MSLPNILALDPGGTTGFCIYRPVLQGLERGQIGPHEHHDELDNLLEQLFCSCVNMGEELHIVCEQFEFRKTERHRDFINYIPREYIGVVKLFFKKMRAPALQLHFQSASQAKGFWDDDKLKKLDLWVPGKTHADDATRHYLYYRVFTLGDKSLLYRLR